MDKTEVVKTEVVKTEVKASPADNMKNVQNHFQNIQKESQILLDLLNKSLDKDLKALEHKDVNHDDLTKMMESVNMNDLNECFNNIQYNFKNQREAFSNMLNNANNNASIDILILEEEKK